MTFRGTRVKIKNPSIWIRIALTFASQMLLFAVLCISKSSALFPFALIPLLYTVGHICLLQIYRYISTPGMIMMNLLMLVRFYLLPLLTLMDPRGGYIDSYPVGVWLLLYEEVFGIAALYIFLPKLKKALRAPRPAIKIIKRNNLYKCTALFVLVSVLFILRTPTILSRYNLIIGLDSETLTEARFTERGGTTFEYFWIDVTRLLIPLTLAVFFSQKYKNSKKERWYHIAFILSVGLSIAVIEGADRGTVLLRGMATIFLLINLLPEKKKSIITVTVVMVAVLGSYLIFIRLIANLNGHLSLNGIVDYIQPYVAGIKNLEILDNAVEEYLHRISLSTVMNDVFGCVPFLSHYTDLQKTCLKYFNMAYGSGRWMEHIVPLFGYGMFYFGRLFGRDLGYLFGPVFCVIMINVVIRLDISFLRASNAFKVYVLAYAAICMSFSHYNGIYIILIYFSQQILPILLVYIFIDSGRILSRLRSGGRRL